jgi:hypothetical protein
MPSAIQAIGEMRKWLGLKAACGSLPRVVAQASGVHGAEMEYLRGLGVAPANGGGFSGRPPIR